MGNLQKFTATETNMSQQVVWNIVRNNHAYLVKSRKSGGVQFSKHPASLKNKNTLRYSGIANAKAITLKSGKTVAKWGAHKGQRVAVLKAGNLVGKMNPALRGAARKRVSALVRAAKSQ